jgi:ERF superfamily
MAEQLEERLTVHGAISRVIGAMPGIGKDQTMGGPGGGYQYRGIEAIKVEIKPLLAAHRVHYALHRIVEITDDTVPVGDKGKVWQRTRLRARWRIYGPDGDYVTVETRGEGVDSSDKAANKAVTGAEKQMLLTTFCVADGDDPDHARPEILEHLELAVWPAKTIKGGMVHEIAAQVTAGDLDRARELAALAWDTFALGDVVELPVDEAREKIDAAVELAKQEAAVFEAIASAEHVPSEPTQPVVPPPMPWSTPTEMRADMKARGITTPAAQREAHAIAKANGLEPPVGSLDAIYRYPDPHFVAAFAAWVRNHDELESTTERNPE